jgi:hypothetical protein
MAHDIRMIVLLAGCAIVASCSRTPRNVEPAARTVASTQAAPQTLAAAESSPPAKDAPTAVAKAAAGDIDASLVKAGYSVMRRHDVVLYCRNETITGQRIATRVCLTAEQIQAEKQNVTKAKDLMSQGGNRCVKPGCS